MNIYTSETEYLKTEVQRLRALVRAQQITIDKLEAQPEQEPVAWAMYQRGMLISFWMDKGDAYDFEFTSEHSWKPLYTSPPAQRTWVGLTDKEIWTVLQFRGYSTDTIEIAKAIEAKLKALNEISET